MSDHGTNPSQPNSNPSASAEDQVSSGKPAANARQMLKSRLKKGDGGRCRWRLWRQSESPVGGGGLFTASPDQEPLPVALPRVTTTPAVAQTSWPRLLRTLVGQVESQHTSAVGFELGGSVIEILVDEGDVVQTGQILAKIDDARLVAQLGRGTSTSTASTSFAG